MVKKRGNYHRKMLKHTQNYKKKTAVSVKEVLDNWTKFRNCFSLKQHALSNLSFTMQSFVIAVVFFMSLCLKPEKKKRKSFLSKEIVCCNRVIVNGDLYDLLPCVEEKHL